jgi:hypothetical protein
MPEIGNPRVPRRMTGLIHNQVISIEGAGFDYVQLHVGQICMSGFGGQSDGRNWD